jgi:gamma-glutamyltranspeptidase
MTAMHDAQNLDWTLPYSSHRSAVMGRNIVSTSQPLAAQAGLRMLLAGGNAVDAALAAAMALTVVEPSGCGIGSDGFAIVWDGKELHGLNASGRSPAAWTPDYFAKLGGIPEKGWNAVTVPGAVSAWVALSQRFGKLPFEQLAQPAIDYARHGFPVSPTIARLWELGGAKLGGQPGFAECFLPGGRAPRAGEVFCSEAHAHTLELIAATQGEAFYRGELAEKMAAHSQANGGAMTFEDLAAHQADWVGTVSQRFGDSVIHEIPPNGQGIAALMALGMLDALGVGSQPLDGIDSVHLQIEAMKLAFADLHQYNADIDHMRVAPADLLRPEYLRERAALIDPASRRHGVSGGGRCQRHDGLVHPVQLHGLRLRRGRAGHRHQPAEPGPRLHAGARPCQRGRPAQAPLAHHHSRLRHARRRHAADGLRRDGRPHAEPGPRADGLARAALRPEPAGRCRCAALARDGRQGRGGGTRVRPRRGRAAARARP